MPAWVSEGSVRKYDRAIDVLKKQNAELKAQGKPEVEITEEAIKALYIKYGGLLKEEPGVEPEVVPEEAPAKKGK